jgi:hypothetical protein
MKGRAISGGIPHQARSDPGGLKTCSRHQAEQQPRVALGTAIAVTSLKRTQYQEQQQQLTTPAVFRGG